MAKKKKLTRNDAVNELKTLESKWLKDQRLHGVEPIQNKVIAAKVAAFLDFVEQSELDLNITSWPIDGAEDLIKFDENNYKRSLDTLQKQGVINSSYKIRKPTAEQAERERQPEKADADGMLTYRCVKAGGLTLNDRDEYILEDQEVAYSENDIEASANLQYAIANEWLVRVEKESNV